MRYAVALSGTSPDRGWLVDAASPDEAVAVVHGTDPVAHELPRCELTAWPAPACAGSVPAGWTVLEGERRGG